MEFPESIDENLTMPTLGTIVDPRFNFNGVIPIKYIRNMNINLDTVQEAVYPLGFTRPLFKTDNENLIQNLHTRPQSEYLDGIKAGLGPLKHFNNENNIPTNLNFTTTPMKNLEMDKNITPFKYGTASWSGQSISRNEYNINLGQKILDLEAPIRAARLY
jgi:hypothetical protein